MNDIAPLTEAQLAAYFARIGFTGKAQPDLATLEALHTAHHATIPFENLDVQLGRPPTLEPDAAFDKLVHRRRGGWCYEQNGLLGRALAAIGFDVTRMSGGVLRQLRGDMAMGSHLCLKVTLERDYLADVGFGGGVGKPVPIAAGKHESDPIPFALNEAEDGYWRLVIDLGSTPMSYDFRSEPADEATLEQFCYWQGNDPDSVFVQNLVVQQRKAGEHVMLRGKVLTCTTAQGQQVSELGSADELVATLSKRFALDIPEAATLWEPISTRHEALFGQPAGA